MSQKEEAKKRSQSQSSTSDSNGQMQVQVGSDNKSNNLVKGVSTGSDIKQPSTRESDEDSEDDDMIDAALDHMLNAISAQGQHKIRDNLLNFRDDFADGGDGVLMGQLDDDDEDEEDGFGWQIPRPRKKRKAV